MRGGRLASQLVPLKGDLLRERWHTRIPYAIGVLLIVVAWFAGAGAAIASEWGVGGTASALFGTIVMGALSLVFLSASLGFHGIASEMVMLEAVVKTQGPRWLVRVYGTGGWAIMLVTLWVVGRNVYDAALMDAGTWPQLLDSMWLSIATGIFVAYVAVFALGTLGGILVEFGVSSDA